MVVKLARASGAGSGSWGDWRWCRCCLQARWTARGATAPVSAENGVRPRQICIGAVGAAAVVERGRGISGKVGIMYVSAHILPQARLPARRCNCQRLAVETGPSSRHLGRLRRAGDVSRGRPVDDGRPACNSAETGQATRAVPYFSLYSESFAKCQRLISYMSSTRRLEH